MFNVGYGGGGRALVISNDASRHIIWRQAVVTEDDTDHRDVDAGENVGRRAEYGNDAEYQDQQRHDYECVRARQSQFYDPNHFISPADARSPPRSRAERPAIAPRLGPSRRVGPWPIVELL